MCKHKWEPLLIRPSEVPDQNRINYLADWILSGSLIQRSMFCTVCGRTGHKINSRRGGIRLHNSDYFLERANGIRKDNLLPLLQKIITL